MANLHSSTRRYLSFFLIWLQITFPGGIALALPSGHVITSGKGSVSSTQNIMTIYQDSPDLTINWLKYNIGSNQTVNYVQPNASSIAINNIIGNTASNILGKINSNGQIWLINPNGILFESSSQVNTRGFLASTLTDYSSPGVFSGNSTQHIENSGHINGSYVALIGQNVINSGEILGTRVILLGGTDITLNNLEKSGQISFLITNNSAGASVLNSGNITANGGQVVLSAGSADSILSSVVTNTGEITANTVHKVSGNIILLSGKSSGTTNVTGSIIAKANKQGNGGNIDTSGARVDVSNTAVVNTSSRYGKTGTWTMDPQSFYIGENISGIKNNTLGNVLNYSDVSSSTLDTLLGTTNVAIDSVSGSHGAQGNIYVDSFLSWNSSNNLTLKASNNVNVNADITNSGLGNIVLRADDMNIGGIAGTGVVNIANNIQVGTSGGIEVFTNPVSYLTAPVNPVNGSAYVNSGTGRVKVYDLISSINDLEYISNNQTTQTLSNNYALNTNIGWITNTTYNFLPIGESSYFSGIFNGLNHTINNLFENSNTTYAGLFGQSTGEIEKIGLTNVNIESLASYSGALVGSDYGTISNAYSTGFVSGAEYTGGLVGYANTNAVLTSDYSTVTTSPYLTPYASGGLVGFNGGTISDSYSTGIVQGSITYVGGLVGDNSGEITNSYSISPVPNSGTFGSFAGTNTGTISNSYATNGNTGLGYLVGNNSGGISGNANTSTNLDNLASTATTWGWNSFGASGYTEPSQEFPWGNLATSAPILVGLTSTENIVSYGTSKIYDGTNNIGTTSLAYASYGQAVPQNALTYSGEGTNTGQYFVLPATTISEPISQNSIGNLQFFSGIETITPAGLSFSTSASKVYDGNSNISLSSGNTSVLGVVSGQSASLANTLTGVLKSSSVGTDISGTFSVNYTNLTGASSFISALEAGDYSISTKFSGGSITPAILTVTGSLPKVSLSYPSKTFYVDPGSVEFYFSGLIPGQNVSFSGATAKVSGGDYSFLFSLSNLAPSSGTNLSNYTLVPVFMSGPVDITNSTMVTTQSTTAAVLGSVFAGSPVDSNTSVLPGTSGPCDSNCGGSGDSVVQGGSQNSVSVSDPNSKAHSRHGIRDTRLHKETGHDYMTIVDEGARFSY